MDKHEMKQKLKLHNAICKERDRLVAAGMDEDAAWRAASAKVKAE